MALPAFAYDSDVAYDSDISFDGVPPTKTTTSTISLGLAATSSAVSQVQQTTATVHLGLTAASSSTTPTFGDQDPVIDTATLSLVAVELCWIGGDDGPRTVDTASFTGRPAVAAATRSTVTVQEVVL